MKTLLLDRHAGSGSKMGKSMKKVSLGHVQK
jgi:hypothetical protein